MAEEAVSVSPQNPAEDPGAEDPIDAYWRKALPSPDSVRRSFGIKTFADGQEFFLSGAVSKVLYRVGSLEGHVRSGGGFKSVWAVGPSGGLRLDCSCHRRAYCAHQVALYLTAYYRLHPLPPALAAPGTLASTQAGTAPGNGNGVERDPSEKRFFKSLSKLLGALAGDPSGPDSDTRSVALTIAWRGELQGEKLTLTPQLRAGDEPLPPGRLLFLGGRRPQWLAGNRLYLHDPEYSPEQIQAASRGKPVVIEGMTHILPLLKDPAVELVQPAPKLRRQRTRVHLRLSLEKENVLLEGWLQSRTGGRRWPLDDRSVCRIEDGTYWLCDPVQMEEAVKAVRRAGFEVGGTTGCYRLPARGGVLDNLLDKDLPGWRKRYRVELDPALSELLSGARHVHLHVSAHRPAGDLDWFEITWSLEAGGKSLSAADLKALRRSGGRYRLLKRGGLVCVDPVALKRQLEELEELGCLAGPKKPEKVPLHFLGRAVELAGAASGGSLPENVRLDPELEELYRKLKGFERIGPVDPPEKLVPILRPYQREGLNFLNFLREFGFGGVLADDMGLGKTVQALALLELERLRAGRAPSLVVCPTTVAPNWVEEARKFTPQIKTVHLKSSREIRECPYPDYDLVVISYALLRRSLPDQAFRFLILDEAQNVKNPLTQGARAVKALRAHRRLALTGTPIENSVTELWSLFDFLMPGFLGNLNHFERCYAKPIARHGEREPLDRLCARVRPFILRRLKSQVASDLPPRVEQNIYCELSPRQKKLYAHFVRAARREINDEIRSRGWEQSRIHVLAALTRLRQLCCHPGLVAPDLKAAGSGKLDAFLELLDTIVSGGHRVLVFSQFVKMLRILEKALKKRGLPYLYLDGSTRDRQRRVNRFQEKNGAPVFLLSLKAGGTGINLTAADYVILFDPWWNPAVENQAVDRVHRLGQERAVTAYRLITRGTLEEKMLELKQRKQDLADRVLASETDLFKRLTREDLEQLLGP